MKLMSHLRLPAVALLAGVAVTARAEAGQREDFLAGRVKECPGCDLSGANFKRRDLTGANLTGANLKDANFHDARLIGARLAGSYLSRANLNTANFVHPDVADAQLTPPTTYGQI